MITKKMIQKVTNLLILSKAKATKTLDQEELQKKTLAKWDGRGLKINNVSDINHIIAHKIYNLSWLNSVPYEAVDLANKFLKKNLEYDMLDVLLKQLNKNIDSVKTLKNNPFKFSSFLTCLFFYVQKLFPSKGTVIWRKDTTVLYQINDFIEEMGENFERVFDNYFEVFK